MTASTTFRVVNDTLQQATTRYDKLQHYNITTLQHYNITTLQHYNITTLQHASREYYSKRVNIGKNSLLLV
jgi:hypothetical protein